jgi:hypothetical protein
VTEVQWCYSFVPDGDFNHYFKLMNDHQKDLFLANVRERIVKLYSSKDAVLDDVMNTSMTKEDVIMLRRVINNMDAAKFEFNILYRNSKIVIKFKYNSLLEYTIYKSRSVYKIACQAVRRILEHVTYEKANGVIDMATLNDTVRPFTKLYKGDGETKITHI